MANSSKKREWQGEPPLGASDELNGHGHAGGSVGVGNGAGNGSNGSSGASSEPLVHAPGESSWRLPTVDAAEVTALSHKYGAPICRSVTLPADESTRIYRFDSRSDRRAEVVFAIEDPSGGIWVHAKAHYPRHLMRLPSGGVHWNEGVEAALLREIDEETGLTVQVQRFLGLIDYLFLYDGRQACFASYLFLVRSSGGLPVPHAGEAITDFQLAPVPQLRTLAADLRNLNGDRRLWGQWRAMVHDLACETLVRSEAPA